MEWVNISSPIDYAIFLKKMEDKVAEIITGSSDEIVYFLEHKDVYTAGSNHKKEELLDSGNIPVILTGRGGKFTYHGPGQAIIYPLIDLRKKNRSQDIRLYVKNLESIVIDTLKHYNIDAYTIEGKVGIWVNNKDNIPAKIGAIGVRIKKWVTYHGIAVNIHTDLEKYKGIIPCGISNFPVTSMQELGFKTTLKKFNYFFKQEFEKKY